MNHNKNIGRKITEARGQTRPRLSRQALADRLKAAGLDVDSAGISEIEAGNRSLNYYQVSLIAAVLETTPTQLLS